MKSVHDQERETYSTVDELIATLKKISDGGRGKYLVSCNMERWVSRKADIPWVDDKDESVDLGGWTD